MWKASCGLSQWETYDNPTPSIITFDDLKEDFLAKVWNSFHLSGKKLDFTSKIFSNTNMNCTLSNHGHHLNVGSLLLTTPQIIDLPLKLDNGQQFLSLEEISYATFALMALGDE